MMMTMAMVILVTVSMRMGDDDADDDDDDDDEDDGKLLCMWLSVGSGKALVEMMGKVKTENEWLES